MLSRQELKDIAKMRGDGAFFVSLYLNVNPVTNAKGNYLIHVKNMIRTTTDGMDKENLKRVGADFEKIESYINANKRTFKRGLVILTSRERDFWKDMHLSVPLKNEIVVDSTPYIKPLLDVLDNYRRYAVLLVEKESARLFLMHLGQLEEYAEVHSEDVPGKHKKGGWFSLQEKSYERHTAYHVSLHLKDVVRHMESFLSLEDVGRIVIGGSDEALTQVQSMLPQPLSEKVIGTFRAAMAGNVKEILGKVEPVVKAFEKEKESKAVDELLTKAMKNENAVLGIENVLHALQEGRIMKLMILKDHKATGLACARCGYVTIQEIAQCPYCKTDVEKANYMVDLIAQKAVEQGAFVEVLTENKKLEDAGSIGALLRF